MLLKMDKFVSSLNRCKKDAVLFHPARKNKYNQLKKKLKTTLIETLLFEQDGHSGKKNKLDIKTEFGKMKKQKLGDLVTILDKTPKRDEKKLAKIKKKNKLKINVKREAIITKPKKNQRKKAKISSDAKVENKIKKGKKKLVDVRSSKESVGVKYCNAPSNVPGEIVVEETYSALETTANEGISDEHPGGEEATVVDMDTTSSPVVVKRKRGNSLTHHMMQDCEENTRAPDDNFNSEFTSVLSCFRNDEKNGKVVLGTCKITADDEKFPLAREKLSAVTKTKRPTVVTVKSATKSKRRRVVIDKSASKAKKLEVVTDESAPFELHSLPSRGCIATMRHPSEVCVQGKVKITVLKGTVEVLGFKLTAENSEHGVCVFCPQKCMPLSIRSHKLPEDARDTSYVKKLEALKGSYAKLLNSCHASDCVLQLLPDTSSVLAKFLNIHFPITLFPKVWSSADRKFHKEENRLQCQFTLPGNNVKMNSLTRKDEWDQAISDMSIFADFSKTVVLGGKGVGKSTFLRYLANCCVSKHGAVLWLDFDPGQAEFTVPGCMSAVLVEKPLLGPNFTHITTPLRMVNLGEIDVSRCPSRYNSCAEHIINYCSNQPDLQKIPWLINTMGFNRGLGVELAIGIIRLLRPTNVIHIESKCYALNYARTLTSSYVNEYTSTWSSGSAVCDLDYATRILPSAILNTPSKKAGLKPRDSRELMVLAYLSQVVSQPRCSLLNVVPYCTPLAKLVLGTCHEVVERSHVLGVMNGSLVALCTTDTRQVWTSGDPDMASILVQAPVDPCLGFGIVRGVDMASKTLYLVTPVLEDDMPRVNCLLMGAVNLPPYIYFAVQPSSGHVPYVSKGGEQPMSRTTRRTFRRLVR